MIRINIDQDSFNKIVTLLLLVYCMGMFSASWYTGKTIDLQGFLILLAPIITHLGHLVADNRREVAVIQTNNSPTLGAQVRDNHPATSI